MSETIDQNAESTAQRKESENTSLIYNTSEKTYALDFSTNPNEKLQVALSTFLESDKNSIKILEINDNKTIIQPKKSIDIGFPASKLKWGPYIEGQNTHNLIATTSDCLRIYDTSGDQIKLKSRLLNDQQKELASPLTSFDWNSKNPNIICCSSIDTTCSIWDINSETLTKLVITHDKEVFDISFGPEGNNFVTVGADCTARLFDTRNLTESSIIYDHDEPLVRIAWNKSQTSHILAMTSLTSKEIILFDIRHPLVPVSKLNFHKSFVNNVVWSPESPFLLCSISEDKHAYLWNVEKLDKENCLPVLEYSSETELNNVTWCSSQDWIGITKENSFIMLRII